MNNIKFSMPELLVVAAVFLYSQSYWFSITAFSLGIISRCMDYLLTWNLEQKKVEALSEELSSAADTFKSIFSKD